MIGLSLIHISWVETFSLLPLFREFGHIVERSPLTDVLTLVTPIVLIVWWCRPSENQSNRFGPVP